MKSLSFKLLLAVMLSIGHINAHAKDVESPAKTFEDNIGVYAELARTGSVRISPNGRYAAMLSPYKGSKGTFIYDLNDPSAPPTVIPPPKNGIAKSIRFASDKHLLTNVQSRHFYPYGKLRKHAVLHYRWYSTNIETGKTVLMLKDKLAKEAKLYQVVNGGNFAHRLPNEANKVLLSFSEYTNRPVTRYWKVNLDSGSSRMVRTLPFSTERILRSQDGNTILARSDYQTRSGKFTVYAGQHPEEKKVYEERFNPDENRTTFLLTTSNGKLILSEDKNSSVSLFQIDMKTGERSSFKLDANVPAGYEYGPIFDGFTRQLIGFAYTDDLDREVYFSAPFDKWHKQATKALKGKNVNILSWTEDRSMVTIYAEGDNDAGTYYLFEPKAGQISPLGGRYPELSKNQIAKTIRSDFKARDGLNIPAYLTLPPGKTKASGPMPLVVLAHGGPIARDDASFDFWAQYIATLGYAVFKPQFRGSSGFSYELQSMGDGEFGEAMLHDTIDGVKALIEQGVVNPDKICATGASYGGYQALALPMIEPDMFKCALSLNGVSDIPKMLDYSIALTGGRESGPVKFWNRIMGVDKGGISRLDQQSPAQHTDKIKAEIVLMHGTDDGTVPIEQTKLMEAALKKAGKSNKVVLLKKDDHNLSLPQSRMKLLKESKQLFAKHLD